ncbi:MAG: hypothetical protein PHD72_03035 [Patescibacteria group bacterium]|nr:hypothetical protein [Patescibacteria group bacterium]
MNKLIRIIDPSLKPIYVPVESEPFAIMNNCFPNVQEKIKRQGGAQILGWQIWQSDFLIEAEFHAIWESPNGDLIDITPKFLPIKDGLEIPISQILFLRDPKRIYDGTQVDNIRLNITRNPLIDDYIALLQAKFMILNKGKRAHKYKIHPNSLSTKERDKLTMIQFFQQALTAMVKNNMDENWPCLCRSGEEYKNCCKKLVKNLFII